MMKRIVSIGFPIRLNALISFIIKLLLFLLLPYLIYRRNYLVAFSALIAILISVSPAIIKRNYNVAIPWSLDLLIALVLYLHTAGLAFDIYDKIVYWDVITHVLGTIIIAVIAFIGAYTLNFSGKVKLSIKMIGFFTFIFALAMGAIWEIGEFAIDQLIGTHSQDSLQDTMWDLIFDALAGGITAILGMIYSKEIHKLKWLA